MHAEQGHQLYAPARKEEVPTGHAVPPLGTSVVFARSGPGVLSQNPGTPPQNPVPDGCVAPPAHTYPLVHRSHDASLPEHEPTGPAPEKYPAAHAQGRGCATPPPHLKPAGHTAQVPIVPEQPIDVTDGEAYPSVHVHETRSAEPPAQAEPAPHIAQVPNIVEQ